MENIGNAIMIKVNQIGTLTRSRHDVDGAQRQATPE